MKIEYFILLCFYKYINYDVKKIFNLITIFCITILLSNTNYTHKKSKNSITFDQALHESVEYREIGPFRGGDLQQLLESLDNPTYIILVLLEVEYGKQRMEVKLMKIFQMVSLVEVLVQLQLLVMIQM